MVFRHHSGWQHSGWKKLSVHFLYASFSKAKHDTKCADISRLHILLHHWFEIQAVITRPLPRRIFTIPIGGWVYPPVIRCQWVWSVILQLIQDGVGSVSWQWPPSVWVCCCGIIQLDEDAKITITRLHVMKIQHSFQSASTAHGVSIIETQWGIHRVQRTCLH